VAAVDPLELRLLHAFDVHGRISREDRVELLVELMMQVAKDETKLLIMTVIGKHMEDGALAHFIRVGGLKIVKYWLVAFDEENRHDVVTTVLNVLKDLPISHDNRDNISQSGLGKVVKTIEKKCRKGSKGKAPKEKGKAEPATGPEQALAALAASVMTEWRTKIEESRPAHEPIEGAAREGEDAPPAFRDASLASEASISKTPEPSLGLDRGASIDSGMDVDDGPVLAGMDSSMSLSMDEAPEPRALSSSSADAQALPPSHSSGSKSSAAESVVPETTKVKEGGAKAEPAAEPRKRSVSGPLPIPPKRPKLASSAASPPHAPAVSSSSSSALVAPKQEGLMKIEEEVEDHEEQDHEEAKEVEASRRMTPDLPPLVSATEAIKRHRVKWADQNESNLTMMHIFVRGEHEFDKGQAKEGKHQSVNELMHLERVRERELYGKERKARGAAQSEEVGRFPPTGQPSMRD
jgi:hypothetical protein